MSSSTAIKASWVDTLPQSAQNIVLPLCKAKGLNALNIFPLDFHFTSQIKSSSSNIIHYPLLIRTFLSLTTQQQIVAHK